MSYDWIQNKLNVYQRIQDICFKDQSGDFLGVNSYKGMSGSNSWLLQTFGVLDFLFNTTFRKTTWKLSYSILKQTDHVIWSSRTLQSSEPIIFRILRAVTPRRHAMFLFLQQEAPRIISKFLFHLFANTSGVWVLLNDKNEERLVRFESDSWCCLATPLTSRRQPQARTLVLTNSTVLVRAAKYCSKLTVNSLSLMW